MNCATTAPHRTEDMVKSRESCDTRTIVTSVTAWPNGIESGTKMHATHIRLTRQCVKNELLTRKSTSNRAQSALLKCITRIISATKYDYLFPWNETNVLNACMVQVFIQLRVETASYTSNGEHVPQTRSLIALIFSTANLLLLFYITILDLDLILIRWSSRVYAPLNMLTIRWLRFGTWRSVANITLSSS